MHQRQRGFTLLEILVSIVILTLGILGAVGLQAASLQATRESRHQSTGVRLADEMAELIRANHQIALNPEPSENPYLIDFRATNNSNEEIDCGLPDSTPGPCPVALIGERDIKDWLNRASQELSGFRAVICFDSAPYDATGLPHWNCTNTGSTLAIKIGWTRSNTLIGATNPDATNTSASNTGAFDKALRPAVIIPVTPGVI